MKKKLVVGKYTLVFDGVSYYFDSRDVNLCVENVFEQGWRLVVWIGSFTGKSTYYKTPQGAAQYG